MKFLFAIAAVIALSACGEFERENAQLTGYSKACVDGVE